MMNQPSDPDLRALFQALRKADEEETPSFRPVLGRAEHDLPASSEELPGRWTGQARRWRRLAVAGSLLAAAAAAFLLLLPGWGSSEAEFELAVRSYTTSPAGGAWRSPTDALLAVPGSDLLTTLPSLGNRTLSRGSVRRPPSNRL